MTIALLLLLAAGAFLLWWRLARGRNEPASGSRAVSQQGKTVPGSAKTAHTDDLTDEARSELEVVAQSARFNFVASPANPQVDLTFRLDNQSRHEIFVEKIKWAITVEPKSVPSARGEFSKSILLLPRTTQDRLTAHGLIDHAEAAYISQLQRGLTVRCHAEGALRGHVKGMAFEKRFACFDIPCVVEKETPFANTYIDTTHIDPLTGLLNRKFLIDNLKTIVAAANFNKPVSFIMLDIDDFKEINDQYGHLIGDDAIKIVCAKIRESVSDKGFAIRYGGDEFSVVLKNFDVQEAGLLAEKIRSGVSEYKFKAQDGQVHLTVSVGVATMQGTTDGTDLMRHADDMLRASKQKGKNRVTEWAA